LSLADLWELCREDKYTPVLDLLQERAMSLSVAGQRRIARAIPVMQHAVVQYGRMPLRRLLESTWMSLGGPAAVRSGAEGEADLRDIAAYLDLVQDCEVAGALPERGTFNKRMESLYAAPDTADGIRVEIMTIYAAKGLEFDTVVVPGLGRTVGGDPQSLLYWRERILGGETHLLLAPMQAVAPDNDDDEATLESYLRRIERDRNREEGKRLLYVACTRARRNLHLLGNVNAEGTAKKDSLLWLLMAAPAIEDKFRQEKPTEEETTFEIAAAAVTRVAPLLRRLPLDWHLPAAPAPLRWKKTANQARHDEVHTFDWVSDTLRRVGTVTHAFLQQIAREGLDHWNDERISASAAMIRTALTAEGVPPGELSSAGDKVGRALRSVITEERGRWILAAREQAASEFEISSVLDGEIVRAKLDRTFVDEVGTRWIIDYKTADVGGGSVESFLDEQEAKYRPDLLRYSRIMRALNGRTVRAGLYFPLLARWREVNLEEAPE
jgi:ATP-dependent exoDNAse (exonuclease V) beta subunit